MKLLCFWTNYLHFLLCVFKNSHFLSIIRNGNIIYENNNIYGLRSKYFAIHTYFEGAFEDPANFMHQVKIKKNKVQSLGFVKNFLT